MHPFLCNVLVCYCIQLSYLTSKLAALHDCKTCDIIDKFVVSFVSKEKDCHDNTWRDKD